MSKPFKGGLSLKCICLECNKYLLNVSHDINQNLQCLKVLVAILIVKSGSVKINLTTWKLGQPKISLIATIKLKLSNIQLSLIFLKQFVSMYEEI